MVRKVGIIGYGNLGKFLVSKIYENQNYELVFVWNRTKEVFKEVDFQHLVLEDLNNFASTKPDLIIEVAHPSITKTYGVLILKHCDYMIGSPTALNDDELLKDLRNAANCHGLYVPSGAFWGGEDIQKLSESGMLRSLSITMKKHPLSLKLQGHLKDKNSKVIKDAITLYHGPVRGVCSDAPNNTNTMAVAAIAAPNLGFDGVVGCLVSDPSLVNYHIVEIEAYGHPKADGTFFHVHTVRKNPAALGEVTGHATFAAYFGSVKRAVGKGPGIHLC
ncbi:hypothetical protein JTE90_010573 [Oedothorax gibbosus]|uniref:Aspartate dehydrogenase domain-containing protein n=1 Tax=Oedothorax gibbosus TaxID=931172 RepID=A0AAV6UFG0_9ARAC|nr:hypothetical protein JTE90_010573 [Oedothorax gibbosus]